MNILTQSNIKTMSSQEVESIELDEDMVFPNMSVAVVYMMHKYITNLDYQIDTPTKSNAVFSLVDASGDFKAELLSNGKVVDFNNTYEEYSTKGQVVDFYAMSAAAVNAHKERLAAIENAKFVEDLKERIASSSKMKRASTKTYFILNTRTSLIKIGKSYRPNERLKEIQGMAGARLKLLAVVNEDIEHELHIRFDAYRRTGEWFEDKDGFITALIKKINEVA